MAVVADREEILSVLSNFLTKICHHSATSKIEPDFAMVPILARGLLWLSSGYLAG
jgi:hypothetical protein